MLTVEGANEHRNYSSRTYADGMGRHSRGPGIYVSTSPESARWFGAGSEGPKDSPGNSTKVYEVEPTGDVRRDITVRSHFDAYVTHQPMRVLGVRERLPDDPRGPWD